MSILTKISIVLLVILVLPISVVIIQQASQLPTYMDAYEARGIQIENISQQNRHLQLTLRAAETLSDNYAKDVVKVVNEKRELRLELQGQITSLVADKLGMKAKLASLDATYRGLDKSLATEIDGRKTLEVALETSREKTNTFKDRIIQLNAALMDNQVAIARLERTVQKFRVDIAIREKEIAALVVQLAAQGRAPAGGDPTRVDDDPPLIQGTITAIEDDVASINIGTAKGIKKGMKLIVFREGDFVAYLQIELVDLNSSAGVIVSKRLEPRADDKVKTNTKDR